MQVRGRKTPGIDAGTASARQESLDDSIRHQATRWGKSQGLPFDGVHQASFNQLHEQSGMVGAKIFAPTIPLCS